ncbi:hypothetical protein [Paenibacillus sp. MBLB4367]|uniref:hypothetical protein n=1 Tax=Paenibacillus sp. MBLB4367 TaxID=3384767 RepID=UPI0039083B9D
MLENKPQWYDELKVGPVNVIPKPTQETIKIIERRVSGNGRMKYKLYWISLCYVLLFGAIGGVGLNIWRGNGMQGEDWTHSTINITKTEVLDNEGNLVAIDRKWLMPEDTFTLYQSYSKSKSEELLKGLEPLDIFRMYVYASQQGDYDTIYALLIKGSTYGTPSLEEYSADMAKDPEGQERTKKQWLEWKKTYRLYEEVDGDEAMIRMTPRLNPSGPIKEDEKFFRLNKNNKDIWKVGWLPLQ